MALGRAMHPVQRPVLALVLRFGSIALVSTMFMFGKLAAESGIHVLEVVFWRQFAGVPLLVAWLAATRKTLSHVRTRRLGGHAVQAAVGIAGMMLSFGAAIVLPLPEATTIGFTAPIFAVLCSPSAPMAQI
jgi:drug/metabolite transporter (DMT)-like permease